MVKILVFEISLIVDNIYSLNNTDDGVMWRGGGGDFGKECQHSVTYKRN